MPIVYQYGSNGYYAGEFDDCGGAALPHNSTRTAPELRDGFIPRWTGKAWEQVENHKDRKGYLNGQQHIIKDYGPLPDGFSDAPPPPTREEQMAALDRAVAARLDDFARSAGYDNIISAASYAASGNSKFRAEAEFAVFVRDATWLTAFKIFAAIDAGERPMPTQEDFLAELPELTWPEEDVPE